MTVMAMTMMVVVVMMVVMMAKMVIFMLLMMKWDKAIVSLCVDNRRSILQNSERKYDGEEDRNDGSEIGGDAPQKKLFHLFLSFI